MDDLPPKNGTSSSVRLEIHAPAPFSVPVVMLLLWDHSFDQRHILQRRQISQRTMRAFTIIVLSQGFSLLAGIFQR